MIVEEAIASSTPSLEEQGQDGGLAGRESRRRLVTGHGAAGRGIIKSDGVHRIERSLHIRLPVRTDDGRIGHRRDRDAVV